MYKFTVPERKRADEKRNESFAILARISVVRGFVCMIVGGNERFVPRPLGLEPWTVVRAVCGDGWGTFLTIVCHLSSVISSSVRTTTK